MLQLNCKNADEKVVGSDNGLNIQYEFEQYKDKIAEIITNLNRTKDIPGEWLQWMNLGYSEETLWYVKEYASMVKDRFENLLILGIGGSALGGSAVCEALLKPYWNMLSEQERNGYPRIFFLDNIDPDTMNGLFDILDWEKTLVNVITKSGSTAETMSQFMIVKDRLEKELGDNYRRNIVATTDKNVGVLRQIAEQEGYKTFVVPDDVGGRFSVLTAVGLLPIAVSGADIDAIMQGAAKAQKELDNDDINTNDCYKYAAIRNILYRKGKTMEVMVSYEPDYTMMSEWFKQLFAESEGKDNKGIFPASVIFSTDLHSLGQYIQDGRRTMFETVVLFDKCKKEVTLGTEPADVDGLNFLSGKTMGYVNQKAFEGTVLAHNDGGVPNIVINVPQMNESELGYLIYFFEKACAISGYMLGVNPFNQPGVESYKKNMFALLGKPGYEEQKAALEARLK